MWGAIRHGRVPLILIGAMGVVACTSDSRSAARDAGASGSTAQRGSGGGTTTGSGGANANGGSSGGGRAPSSGGVTESMGSGGVAAAGGAGGRGTGGTNHGGQSGAHADSGNGGTTETGGAAGAGGLVLPPHPDAGRDIGCYLADPSNNDPNHATPYMAGSTVFGCLQSFDDKDYYDFTTPPGQPGYLVVRLAGVHDYNYADDVNVYFYTGDSTHST
jgi:hypothetical protein